MTLLSHKFSRDRAEAVTEDCVRVVACIDHHPAVGVKSCLCQKSTADSLVKLKGFTVQAILDADTGDAVCSRKVKEQGEVGAKSACRKVVPLTKQGFVEASRIALVHDGRVGEAVTEDNLATFESGSDKGFNVLCAVGKEQEDFAFGRRAVCVEQERPDLCSDVA